MYDFAVLQLTCDIAYKPEASPSYDFAGQPTGNKTHHQNNQQA